MLCLFVWWKVVFLKKKIKFFLYLYVIRKINQQKNLVWFPEKYFLFLAENTFQKL